MNRRSFFKVVTGFVAGAVASVMPKAVGSKRSGTRKLTKEEVEELVSELPNDFTPPYDDIPTIMPSEQDNICAELQKHADYATQSAPFIQHLGVWFFADADIIKYCPVSKLRWDNWSTLRIQDYPDTFDFWQKIDGKLYWVGERYRWQILPTETPMFKIQLCGFWDGENWNNYD